MTYPSQSKTALVLSGGGAYGAYEVGVVKALARGLSPATSYRPFDPDIYTGTSAGAYNATYLASRWQEPFIEAAAHLEKTWLEVISDRFHRWGNGVYRYRLNPFDLFNPLNFGSHPIKTAHHITEDLSVTIPKLFQTALAALHPKYSDPATRLLTMIDLSAWISMKPLEETLRRTINFENVLASPKFLSLAATRWRTGQTLLALKHEMTPQLGPKLTKGSASIPGIFPAEPIGSDHLVDGGVLMNTPLDPAIKAGADTLYVVDLSPRTQQIPMMLLSTLGMMNRALLTAWDYRLQIAINYSSTWVALERSHTLLKQHYRATSMGKAANDQMLEDIDRAWRTLREILGPSARQLTIHLLRPKEFLGGGSMGTLNFRYQQIEDYIRQGFENTVNHDCTANGCLLHNSAPHDNSQTPLEAHPLEHYHA